MLEQGRRPDRSFSFPFLSSPLSVGSLTLRNRFVSSANYTALSIDNLPTERYARYHAEKAKGGLALTITGELVVSPSCKYSLPRSIHAYDRNCIPGFKLMTEMVHENGALAVAQLQHAGARGYGFDPYGLSVKLPMAPSNLATTVDPDGYTVPISMDESQIQQELEYYRIAATNLLEAGFDGVEIKSDSSSLPIQFLSPLTNKRNDEYGGTLENRMRFLDLLISVIHEVTSGRKIMGIKIPGDEFVEGGLSREAILQVARHIDRANSVDYIAVGGGNLGFDPDLNTPSAYYPQGLFVELAQGVRAAISKRVKVIALGRIIDPLFAEDVVASGKSDLVSMMRAMIADPHLPRKTFEGRTSEIIPCIGCNQGCLTHVLTNRPTACVLNPVTGREKEWDEVLESKEKKKILVIGAGPAGIEFARLSSMRGHTITLFEREDRIGGQTNLMASLPGRMDTKRAISFWKSEIDRLNIKLILNHNVGVKEIIELRPDAVVFATGATNLDNTVSPAFPKPAGTRFLKSLEDLSLLQEGSLTNHKAVVYDDRGDFQALGWVELLVGAGARVTLLTRHSLVAPFVEPWTRLTACKRLLPKGVTFVADSYLKEIKRDSVIYFNIFNKIETEVESNFTYFVSWPLPENSLYNELKKNKQIKSYSIGDCRAPRSLEEAIFEGHELARRL
jgi:2,4-dienoyl-CoA reductase-like NADH-dependent reductase (Old Yellow Enzyme family)/thioredoxin reductase